MSGFRLLVKNSTANVAAGVANALLVVALPPVLVRYLSEGEFSAWSVVLQLALIVNVFQFGVQVAVGRYVAYCTARGDMDFRRQIVSTAFAAMWAAAALALVFVAIAVWLLPRWFPDMPSALEGDARAAMLLIGASIALGLPASVVGGIYSGLQRNGVPAAFVVASRIALVLVLVALVVGGFGLVPLAAAYATIITGAALLQLWMLRATLPEFSFRRKAVTRGAARELADYCVSLTVWSVGILVISGLDAVIAGRFDFHWAAYFGVAASAVTLIVGLQSAVLQPLIAIAAHLHSRGEKREIGRLLVDVSRVNTLLFLAAIAAFFVAGERLTALWVGEAIAPKVLPIVQVLLLGVFLRQTLAPFATILLGTGEQRLVVWTPAYEAAAKLAASIILGAWIGPVGIALGTVIGAIVCVVTNVVSVFPRVTGFALPTRTFLVQAIAVPTLAFAPLLILPLFEVPVTTSLIFTSRTILVTLVGVAAAAMAFASLRRVRALV